MILDPVKINFMEIDFKEIIKSRVNILDERKTQLDKIKNDLIIEGPHSFLVSEIIKKENYSPRRKGLKVGITQLAFLEELKGSYLYFFELDQETNKKELINTLKEFQNKNKTSEQKLSIPKIPISFKNDLSDILYIGSIKENIHKRIKEHIGFGSCSTYAMHLRFWAPK